MHTFTQLMFEKSTTCFYMKTIVLKLQEVKTMDHIEVHTIPDGCHKTQMSSIFLIDGVAIARLSFHG